MRAGAAQVAAEEEGVAEAPHLKRGLQVEAVEEEDPRVRRHGQGEVAEAGLRGWEAGAEELPCLVGWVGEAAGRRKELWTGEVGEELHGRPAPEEEGEGRSRGEGEEEEARRGTGEEEAELVFSAHF